MKKVFTITEPVVGIFSRYQDVQKLVEKYPYKEFNIDALDKKVAASGFYLRMKYSGVSSAPEVEAISIYTNKLKKSEYIELRGTYIETGTTLFYKKIKGSDTVVAEFLGVGIAYYWCQEKGLNIPIYHSKDFVSALVNNLNIRAGVKEEISEKSKSILKGFEAGEALLNEKTEGISLDLRLWNEANWGYEPARYFYY